jgi:alkanesulfonate monooxygenase SsuD/methylene tetrahydromethanopterin reductase-like flavin-dependent oxidoreductase (luciferase family)
LFHQLWAHAGTSDRRCIDDAIADIILADELGYESCWLGEHHHNRHKPIFGRLPHPELLIARLSTQTRQIRLGTGVKVLPYDAPCRFAESVVLLDMLADGRAVFGVGMSMRSDKLAATHERGAQFRDQLSALMDYLDNDHAKLEPLTPAPLRDYRDLLWVAAREPQTIVHAAGLGLNLLVGQLEQAVKQREFTSAFRQAGGRGEIRGVRLVHVAASDHDAWCAVETAARRMYHARAATAYGRLAVAEGRMSNRDTDDPIEMLRAIDFIAGSPQTVARALHDYQHHAGVDRVDLMMHVPDIASDAIRRSMQLFASEVAPAMPHLHVNHAAAAA